MCSSSERRGVSEPAVQIADKNSTDLGTLRALIEAGALRPVIDRVVGLHQVPDAIRDLAGGHVQGKIFIGT